MPVWLFCLCLASAPPSDLPQQYRAEIEPIDLRMEKVQAYFSGAHQIATDGKRLFLRSVTDTEILVAAPDGLILATFGGKGHHPAEFGDIGVIAMAVDGGKVMAIDANFIRARTFNLDGAYQSSFLIKPYFRLGHLPTASNVFAFSDQYTVIPTDQNSGHLAAVYDAKGQFVKYIGELLDLGGGPEFHIPGINETLWLHEGKHWYAIHKYLAMVTVFDEDFAMVTQYQIQTARAQEMQEYVLGFQPDEHANVPTPILSDAQVWHGDLYILCGGWLHQLSPQDGQVKSVTTFMGKGEAFRDLPVPYVIFYTFAILDNGGLILGHHAQMWDHDLWRAPLPFIQTKAKR